MLKIRGRKWQQEHERTIALIIKHKKCTLECNKLTTCPRRLHRLVAESSLLELFGQLERPTANFDIRCCHVTLNLLALSVSVIAPLFLNFLTDLHADQRGFTRYLGRASVCRRVASQFFLVSPDSQIDEALADPIIFRVIFISQNGDEKKKQNLFLQ